MEFTILSGLSFLFGLFQKIADGHDEHGLRWFYGADIFFGVLWGAIGGYLMGYSEVLFATYASLYFYWIYKGKSDYFNHAISLIITLFFVFYASIPFPIFQTLGLLIAYIIFDHIKHLNDKILHSFFYKYRLHFFLIPLVYALLIKNIYGFSAVLFNLFGIVIGNLICFPKKKPK